MQSVSGSNRISPPQDDPLQRQPVIALAQSELGWQPTVALNQGLDATIAYFRGAIA